MKIPQTFEEQTEYIVESLLSEFLGLPSIAKNRSFHEGYVPIPFGHSMKDDCVFFVLGEPSSFDVTIIAARLRKIGDQFNGELEQSANQVIREVTTGQVVAVLKDTVKSLSQTWCAQDPNLAYERAFLAVSVKLLETLSKKIPQSVQQLVGPVRDMINENAAIRQYIEGQGGWVSALLNSLLGFCLLFGQ
ncbi:bcl-2-like protein 15 isoform X3 [Macrotis lagotis]|uniref:bcl-2-like protein 15 isoform X3 n=1 Tax=Macrotis lagotis TaxID=92651 RepID=UPI003D68DBAF